MNFNQKEFLDEIGVKHLMDAINISQKNRLRYRGELELDSENRTDWTDIAPSLMGDMYLLVSDDPDAAFVLDGETYLPGDFIVAMQRTETDDAGTITDADTGATLTDVWVKKLGGGLGAVEDERLDANSVFDEETSQYFGTDKKAVTSEYLYNEFKDFMRYMTPFWNSEIMLFEDKDSMDAYDLDSLDPNKEYLFFTKNKEITKSAPYLDENLPHGTSLFPDDYTMSASEGSAETFDFQNRYLGTLSSVVRKVEEGATLRDVTNNGRALCVRQGNLVLVFDPWVVSVYRQPDGSFLFKRDDGVGLAIPVRIDDNYLKQQTTLKLGWSVYKCVTCDTDEIDGSQENTRKAVKVGFIPNQEMEYDRLDYNVLFDAETNEYYGDEELLVNSDYLYKSLQDYSRYVTPLHHDEIIRVTTKADLLAYDLTTLAKNKNYLFIVDEVDKNATNFITKWITAGTSTDTGIYVSKGQNEGENSYFYDPVTKRSYGTMWDYVDGKFTLGKDFYYTYTDYYGDLRGYKFSNIENIAIYTGSFTVSNPTEIITIETAAYGSIETANRPGCEVYQCVVCAEDTIDGSQENARKLEYVGLIPSSPIEDKEIDIDSIFGAPSNTYYGDNKVVTSEYLYKELVDYSRYLKPFYHVEYMTFETDTEYKAFNYNTLQDNRAYVFTVKKDGDYVDDKGNPQKTQYLLVMVEEDQYDLPNNTPVFMGVVDSTTEHVKIVDTLPVGAPKNFTEDQYFYLTTDMVGAGGKVLRPAGLYWYYYDADVYIPIANHEWMVTDIDIDLMRGPVTPTPPDDPDDGDDEEPEKEVDMTGIFTKGGPVTADVIGATVKGLYTLRSERNMETGQYEYYLEGTNPYNSNNVEIVSTHDDQNGWEYPDRMVTCIRWTPAGSAYPIRAYGKRTLVNVDVDGKDVWFSYEFTPDLDADGNPIVKTNPDGVDVETGVYSLVNVTPTYIEPEEPEEPDPDTPDVDETIPTEGVNEGDYYLRLKYTDKLDPDAKAKYLFRAIAHPIEEEFILDLEMID